MPGNYLVSLSKFEDGQLTELVAPQKFTIKTLNAATLPAPDKKALDAFSKKVAEIRRATGAAAGYKSELDNKITYIKAALVAMTTQAPQLTTQLHEIEKKLRAFDMMMYGDGSLARREFETPPSITGRIGAIEGSVWSSTSAPTQTAVRSYEIAAKQFEQVLVDLKAIDEAIKKLEAQLEQYKAPYTPGRFPEWKR
jgi:chromosome segregation ATPase